MHLISQQLKTYSQVLTLAREVEQGLERKNKKQKKDELVKRTFQHMNDENSIKSLDTLMAKTISQSFPSLAVCNFSQKPGHYKRDCWMANRLCLGCGTGDHVIRNCLIRKMETTYLPILPTLQS